MIKSIKLMDLNLSFDWVNIGTEVKKNNYTLKWIETLIL